VSRRASAWWWTVLTALLAGGYLVIAIVGAEPSIRWPALIGTVLVGAGLWIASRSGWIALAAIIVGALLPVVTGWWSLVVPLTAALIVVCGTVAVRRARDRAPLRIRAST
jgi:uncharacterized membrane protein